MLHLIIGHRGTGKTSLLNRLKTYHSRLGLECKIFDLDQELALRSQQSIGELFQKLTEEEFRNLEEKTLNEVVSENRSFEGNQFVAVGAGYVGKIPSHAKVIWLRRPTDRNGRVFLDRPRLEKEMSPLEEYRARYLARVARYRAWHHKQLTIEEGWDFENSIEPILLGLKPAEVGMSITVLPETTQNEIRLEDFITEKIQLGVKFFELRDDLLDPKVMDRLFNELPHDRILFGFRTKQSAKTAKDSWWFKCAYDWALELGECPWGVPKILSLHYRDRNEGMSEVIERLSAFKAEHYKLAVPVDSLVELWTGHAWRMEDPENRSFLPMSPSGKWWWYRALQGSAMKINFVSDGEGSSFDQPTMFQQLMVEQARTKADFAAVLGSPIQHSRTPAEQFSFFKSLGMPSLGIDLSEADCNELGLSILSRLGLRAAAVTSPLKDKVAGLCERLEGVANELHAVNTILWSSKWNCWLGANTDVLALEKVFSEISLPKNVFVWGGGGMRSTLIRLLPQAKFFRARSGDELFGKTIKENPDMLVWAVGRSRQADCVWPNENWKPLMVLDLNYTEDSPGREYAQKIGAKYISGLEMFRLQAEAQRSFWQEYFKTSEGPQANL